MAPFMRPSASFKTSSTSSIMASIPFYAHAKEDNYIYHDQNHSRRFLPIPHPISTTVNFRKQIFSLCDLLNRYQRADRLFHYSCFKIAFFPKVQDQNG